VGADIDDADGPTRGGEQKQSVAQQCPAIAPIERGRIEHDRQSAKRQCAASKVVAGDGFAQKQPRGGDYPKRRGVAQDDGTAGGHELDADRDQRREGDHVGKSDSEHDRKVASSGNDQVSLAPQQTQQHDGGDKAAQSHCPQGRNTLDHQLGHRPVKAPGRGRRRQTTPARDVSADDRSSCRFSMRIDWLHEQVGLYENERASLSAQPLSGLIALERGDSAPLTRQLYEQLRSAIAHGRLRHGYRLPSSRMVAEHLGVSRNTVAAAVDQLANEGYLDVARGRRPSIAAGLVLLSISDAAGRQAGPAARQRLSRWARSIGQSDWPFTSEGVARPFVLGLADERAFPHDIWGRCLRRAARSIRSRGGSAHNRPALLSTAVAWRWPAARTGPG
jgi:Bacterial regulatory proteins, gntR family